MHVRAPLSALLLPLLLPVLASAQSGSDPGSPWGVRVRAVLSGDSYDSDPAGYKIYSGVALEAAVVRRVSEVVALELSVRTESREVEGPRAAGVEHRLGSLEMVPVTLSAQWRPRGHVDAPWQPYVGAGVNVTGTWEKSGALDSTNPGPTVGPAVVAGMDWRLAGAATFTLDARWNTLRVDIEDFGTTIPSVRIDPLSLGMGIGLRF